jgi:hypothetical protein
VGRLAALSVLVALAAACQLGPAPAPSPLASPTPHTPVTQADLQPGDVPAGLAGCPGSGPLTTYIAGLRTANPALAERTNERWGSLKGGGATEAAISLFAADPAACNAEFAATGSIKSAASLVVAFADEGQADRAWQADLIGFVPPSPGEAAPGITRGAPTGLGPSSWTYLKAPVQLAVWRKGVFVAAVVLANLDGAAFKAATAAVDAHLN